LVSRFSRDDVFFDVVDSKPGYKWTELLTERVSACDVLVAIIGRDWNPVVAGVKRRLDDPDDNVRFELETAFSRKISVIPVLVDGATLANATDGLPDGLKQLSEWQAVDISETHFDYDIARLTQALWRVTRRTRLRKRIATAAIGAVVTVTFTFVVEMMFPNRAGSLAEGPVSELSRAMSHAWSALVKSSP
jgi:hypothetical protein